MQRRSKMRPKKRPKKRHTVRNIILTIIGLLVVGGAATGSYAYYKVNSTITKMQKSSKTTKSADKLTSSKKPVSYLLLGTDTGELGRNYKGRTDTMIVMTINPKTNVTTMTSIPRDTLVTVSGQQMKINAAYADEKEWARKAILNIAASGKFSSDRTIQEYVDDI